MTDTPGATEATKVASPALLRRLAAMLYDTLLLLPLVMLTVVLVMGARSLLGLGAGQDGTVQLDANLVRLLALLTVMGFFCSFWLKGGQTLGMQAWRIKLVSADGAPLKLRQTIIRGIAAILSLACLGLGYLWCVVDRNGRYWHDYLSGTQLILLPKRDKKKSH